MPLTVSPFVTLPKAPTLPHNYATLPSTLPPSILTSAPVGDSSDDAQQQLPAYVSSASGFRAHPSTIIAQNKALREQIDNAAVEGHSRVRAWRDAIGERDLADKRRKAPGWLDSDAKILQPANMAALAPSADARPGASLLDVDEREPEHRRPQESGNDLGAQMDRAFG